MIVYYDSSSCRGLRNLHSVPRDVCTNLWSHLECASGSLPHSLPGMLRSCVFDTSHANRWEVMSLLLIDVFWKIRDVEEFSMDPLVTCVYSLAKSNQFISSSGFLCIEMRFLYILGITILSNLIKYMVCKCLLLLHRFSSNSINNFLCNATSYFDVISLAHFLLFMLSVSN